MVCFSHACSDGSPGEGLQQYARSAKQLAAVAAVGLVAQPRLLFFTVVALVMTRPAESLGDPFVAR
ncbi:hypothetical protein DIPPA_32839 [Diplonema papillatum]|nr:hypothetical protein DIPPA_32839 [Diplonema papillatum]